MSMLIYFVTVLLLSNQIALGHNGTQCREVNRLFNWIVVRDNGTRPCEKEDDHCLNVKYAGGIFAKQKIHEYTDLTTYIATYWNGYKLKGIISKTTLYEEVENSAST
ncbi:hypothetical protein ACOME3_007845 [Neoechinorhynchus agilis]